MFNNHRPHRRRFRSRCKSGRGFGILRPTVLTALLAATVAAGSALDFTSTPAVSAQPQMVQPGGKAASPTPKADESPLDQPLRLLAEAQQVYAQVHSYECILISQERINGKLLPEKVTQMTFRKNPFSVYMKWLAPKEDAGQEVCFVTGRYQNMMRVLPGGGAKMFGWQSIAVDSPQVLQHSRHKITEAGFGNWLDRCAKSWTAERTMGKTQAKVDEYEYNKRRCMRVETLHTTREPQFYCYRNVVYFDKETRLPVRMECYDWPRQGGPPEGELLECFSYINLQFNVTIPEAVFTH
jgi:Protein of unknown function (DUF1571)